MYNKKRRKKNMYLIAHTKSNPHKNKIQSPFNKQNWRRQSPTERSSNFAVLIVDAAKEPTL